jgi:hypothetical protein
MIAEDSRPAAEQTALNRRSKSPAQIVLLVIGVWWVTNGVGAFFVDPNFATAHVHGQGQLGGVSITANGWHAVFHLLPGLLGIALARSARAAVRYAIGIGAFYIAAGSWGLLAGGDSLSVIAVDAAGEVVHVAEGLIVLVAGLLSIGVAGEQRRPGTHRLV